MKKFLNYKNIIVQKSMAEERDQIRNLNTLNSILLKEEYLLDEAIRTAFDNIEPFVSEVKLNDILPSRIDAQGNDMSDRYQAIVISPGAVRIVDDIGVFSNEDFYWSLIGYPITRENSIDTIREYRRDFNIERGQARDLPKFSKISGGWIKRPIESDEDGREESFEYKFVAFVLKPEYVYHLMARYEDPSGTEVAKLLETPYTKASYVFPMMWAKEFFASVYSEYISLKLNENILQGINVDFGPQAGGVMPILKNRTSNLFKENIEELYNTQYVSYYSGSKKVIDFEVDPLTSTFKRTTKNPDISPTYGNIERLNFPEGENRKEIFENQYRDILKTNPSDDISPFELDEKLNVSCYYSKDVACFIGAIAPGPVSSGLMVGINLPAFYDAGGNPIKMKSAKTSFSFANSEKIQANVTDLYIALKGYVVEVLDAPDVVSGDSHKTTRAQSQMDNVFKTKIEQEIDEVLREIRETLDRNAKFMNTSPGPVPTKESIDEEGVSRTVSNTKYIIALQKYLSFLKAITPKTLDSFCERLSIIPRKDWAKIPKSEFNLKQLLLED